jgi:hypothetical protein
MLASLVCGCGTAITFTPLNGGGAVGQSRPAESVDVFLTEPPARGHRDVGLLEARQESDLSADDTASMLRQLREAAGRAGCDAMFVKNVGSNAQYSALAGTTTSVKAITATCLRYVQ